MTVNLCIIGSCNNSGTCHPLSSFRLLSILSLRARTVDIFSRRSTHGRTSGHGRRCSGAMPLYARFCSVPRPPPGRSSPYSSTASKSGGLIRSVHSTYLHFSRFHTRLLVRYCCIILQHRCCCTFTIAWVSEVRSPSLLLVMGVVGVGVGNVRGVRVGGGRCW